MSLTHHHPHPSVHVWPWIQTIKKEKPFEEHAFSSQPYMTMIRGFLFALIRNLWFSKSDSGDDAVAELRRRRGWPLLHGIRRRLYSIAVAINLVLDLSQSMPAQHDGNKHEQDYGESETPVDESDGDLADSVVAITFVCPAAVTAWRLFWQRFVRHVCW